MKKVFLSLAVLFSVALVSCGGHKAAEEAQEEAPVEEVVADAAVVEDTVAPDSVVADTVIAVAAEQAPAEAK
ncbi:MAG: hypothetical protein J1F16_03900 [Muribaculaceae bacterium]|nr:hypothetical protein [Muribaculaceae bacterium]